jgi:hypothetical protein
MTMTAVLYTMTTEQLMAQGVFKDFSSHNGRGAFESTGVYLMTFMLVIAGGICNGFALPL